MDKERRQKKYEQIRMSLMSITKAKDDALCALIALGKKMGPFRYLMIVALFVFLFAFHTIFNLFVQMKLRERFARVMAATMSLVLIITSISIPTYAVENMLEEGSQTITQEAVSEENEITYIKGFEKLDEWITMQYIQEGGSEGDIYFPNEIVASVFVVSEKIDEVQDSVDNPEAEDGQEEPEAEDGQEEPEAEDGQEEPETEDGQEEPEAEDGQEEPEVEGGQEELEVEGGQEEPEAEDGQEEPVVEEDQEEPETEDSQEEPVVEENPDNPDDVAFGLWKISTVAVKMPILYSEPNEVQVSTITEDMHIDVDVTWNLIGDIPFDASPDRIKSDYEYEMVLPDGFELAEGVEMPTIHVHIETPTENVMLVDNGEQHSGVYETLVIRSESLNHDSVRTSSDTDSKLDESAGFYDSSYANLYSGADVKGALPDDGKITMKSGVPYVLASYEDEDCIRVSHSEKSAAMNLNSLSAYDRVYVLATAGGKGASISAPFSVTLTYTDGETDEGNFELHDWFNNNTVSGIEKYAQVMRDGDNNDGSTDEGPYLQSVSVDADQNKVLQSITFAYTGESTELYCGVYAVTGKFATGVPAQLTTVPTAVDVSANAFTLNWDNVDGATGYNIDVATDKTFTTIIEGYNNKQLSSSDYTVKDDKIVYEVGGARTAIAIDTTYYFRVRPYNNNGQGASSPIGNVTTKETVEEPVIDGGYEQLKITNFNGNTVKTDTDTTAMLDAHAGFYDDTFAQDKGIEEGEFPKDSLTINGVTYSLPNDYSGNDSIHLTTDEPTETMSIESKSAYERIYILAVAGGIGTGHDATFKVTLNYTSGAPANTTLYLHDWYDSRDPENKYAAVRRYKVDGLDDKSSTTGAPYLQQVSVEADPSRVLQSITFEYAGNLDALCCAVYAVTGKLAEGVPTKVTTEPKAVNTSTNAFTLNWDKVDGATGYYIDVATDETFATDKIVDTNKTVNTMVDGYNNKQLNSSNYTENNGKIVYRVGGKGTEITSGVTYYFRVRPYNEKGQGPSSPTGNVTLQSSGGGNETPSPDPTPTPNPDPVPSPELTPTPEVVPTPEIRPVLEPAPGSVPVDITVPVSREETDNVVHIKAIILDKAAKIVELTAEELNEVAKNETETKSIEINLKEAGAPIKEAILPTESLKEISNIMEDETNKLDTVTIKLSTATVEVSEQTLKAVLSRINGNDLRLIVDDTHKDTLNTSQKEAIKEQNVHQCIDAYFISDGVRIGEFDGGEVIIKLPFEVPQGFAGEDFSVWYVADDGSIEKHDTQYVNGELIFTVNHFSDYVVVYDVVSNDVVSNDVVSNDVVSNDVVSNDDVPNDDVPKDDVSNDNVSKDNVPKTGEAVDYTAVVWTLILAIGVVGLVLERQKKRQ